MPDQTTQMAFTDGDLAVVINMAGPIGKNEPARKNVSTFEEDCHGFTEAVQSDYNAFRAKYITPIANFSLESLSRKDRIALKAIIYREWSCMQTRYLSRLFDLHRKYRATNHFHEIEHRVSPLSRRLREDTKEDFPWARLPEPGIRLFLCVLCAVCSGVATIFLVLEYAIHGFIFKWTLGLILGMAVQMVLAYVLVFCATYWAISYDAVAYSTTDRTFRIAQVVVILIVLAIHPGICFSAWVGLLWKQGETLAKRGLEGSVACTIFTLVIVLAHLAGFFVVVIWTDRGRIWRLIRWGGVPPYKTVYGRITGNMEP